MTKFKENRFRDIYVHSFFQSNYISLTSIVMISAKVSHFLRFFLCCCLPLPLLADWQNWRGPNYNGSATGDDSYPVSFDRTKNVKWSFNLDGSSASTPIIVQDRVFLSGLGRGEGESAEVFLQALCISRATGKLIWSANSGSGYKPGSGDGTSSQLDSRSNYSSPSPVASSDKVVFFYGNGDLVAYSLDGDKIWSRNIQQDFGDFCFQWTFSASPTLWGNFLYLPVLQRDEQVHGRGRDGAVSFLLCLDLSNGKTVWEHTRETDARKESRESFSTIIPHEGNLLVAGGDYLTSHDPKTGKELWRWGTWNPAHRQEWWRLVPSPVAGAGQVLVCAPKNAPVYAITLPSDSSISPKLSWDSSGNKSITSDVPTPLFYKDHFYVLSDLRMKLSKIKPLDGSVVWELDLPGKYKWRASPTAAGGNLYMMNHNAMVLVVSADSGDILNSVKMGDEYDDQTRSSIALSGGQAFIRTNKKLYCIE